MLSDSFTALLACPVCRETVARTADGSELVCCSCGRHYPVRNGIPMMLGDELPAEASTPAIVAVQ